jgi:transcriptional regulator with XRE-family HTH domain
MHIVASMPGIEEFMRDLREQRGWSQKTMAAELEWVQSKISKIETGGQKPTYADLKAISSKFRVPMRKLIGMRWES